MRSTALYFASVCVILAACTGPSTNDRAPTTSGTEPAITTTTAVPASTTTQPGGPEGALARVIARGSLRVGIVAGTPLADFERRLIEAIAAEIDPGLFVQTVEVTSATRFQLLEDEQVDLVMGGISRTTARDELFGRTSNYLMDGIAALVPADSTIEMVDDLDGRTIAVTEGTSLGILLASTLQAQDINVEILFAQDPLAAVTLDEADAATTSIVNGLSGWPGFRSVPIAADTGVAVLTRLEDSDLTAALDEGLRRLIADGRWEQFFEEAFAFSAPWTVAEMAAAGPID